MAKSIDMREELRAMLLPMVYECLFHNFTNNYWFIYICDICPVINLMLPYVVRDVESGTISLRRVEQLWLEYVADSSSGDTYLSR